MAQQLNASGSDAKLKPKTSSRVSSALKSGVVYGGSAVLTAVNNITPHIAGAVDILVIEQPNGSRKATPFYVRFGKYTALRTGERDVKLYVNDELAPFGMHIGMYGQAYFATDTVEVPAADGDEEQDALLAGMMSPPSGYSSGADDAAAGPVEDAGAGLREEASEGSGSQRPNAANTAVLGASGIRARRGVHASPPALGSIPDSPSGEVGEGGGAGRSTGGGATVAAAGRLTAGIEVGPSLTASDRNESFLSARETLPMPLGDEIVSAALAAGFSSMGTGRPQQDEPSNPHEATTTKTGEGWSSASRMLAPPPASEGTCPSGWSDEEGEGGQSGHTGSSPMSYASPPDRARLLAMACGSETWSPVELPAASPLPGGHTQLPANLPVQQTQQQEQQQQTQQEQQQPPVAPVGIPPHGVQQPLHQQLGFPENPSPVFQTICENGAPPTVPALASATADAGKLPPLLPTSGLLPSVDWQQLLSTGKPPASEAPAAMQSSVISHALSVAISTRTSGDAADADSVADASALRADLAQSAVMTAACGAEMLRTSPMVASPDVDGLSTWAAQVEGGAPASHGSAPHAAVSLLSCSLRVSSGARGSSVGSGGGSSGMVAADTSSAVEVGFSGSAPGGSWHWPQAAHADLLRLKAHNAAMATVGAGAMSGVVSPQALQLAAASAALDALLPSGGATGVVAGGAGGAGAGACLGPIAAAASAAAVASYGCTSSSSRAVALTLSLMPDDGVCVQLSVLPPLLSPLSVALPVDVSTAAAAAAGGTLNAAHGLLGESTGSVVSVASGAISPCGTDPSAANTTAVHGRSMSHTNALAHHHPHAILEQHLHSTSAPPPSSGAITAALGAAAAVAAAPAAALASCAWELSLCGGLLTRSMSHSEATALFEARRLSEELFAIRGPALLASPDLVVRLSDGAMYPWQALSYSLAGLLAFGTWRLPVDIVCWAPEGSAMGGLGPGLGPGTTAAAAAVTALLSAVAQSAGVAVSAQAGGKDSEGGGNDGATSAAAVRCMTSVTTTPKKDAAAAAVAGSAGAGTAGGGSSWRLWMFGSRRDSTGRTSATGGTVTGKSPPGASSPVAERPGAKPSGRTLSAATSPPPVGTTAAASAQSPTQQPSGAVPGTTTDGAAAEAVPVGSSMGGGGSGGAALTSGGAGTTAAGATEGGNRSGHRGGHGRSRRQGYNVVTKKSLTPVAEQLAALPLKHGQNTIVYKIGGSELKAYVYYLPWRTKIVISDIDGTITRSDVLGHLLPAMGLDWSHPGIAQLLTNIRQNNYLIMYLSSRSISQANITRDFINTLVQGEHRMPLGPVIISPHGLLPSLYREMILRRPHEFKIATLQDIRALFPPSWNPFYGGFGNRDTDEISYREVGVPPNRIFIINPRGELRQPKDHTTTIPSFASESQQSASDRDTGTDSGTESSAAEPPSATTTATGGIASSAASGSGTSPGSDVLTGEGPGRSAASASGPPPPALLRNAGSGSSRGRGAASAAATSPGGPTALSSLSAINDFVHHIFPPVAHEMSEGQWEGEAAASEKEAAVGEETAQVAGGATEEREGIIDRCVSRDIDDFATENGGRGVDGGIGHSNSSGKLAKALAGSSAALGYTTAAGSVADLVAWGVASTEQEIFDDIAASSSAGPLRTCICEESAATGEMAECDSPSAAATPLAACSPRHATTSNYSTSLLDAQEGVSGGGAVHDEAGEEGGAGCSVGSSREAEGWVGAAAPVEVSDSLPNGSSSACWLPSYRSGGREDEPGSCRRASATDELSGDAEEEGRATQGACNGGGDGDGGDGHVEGLSERGITVRVPVRDGEAGDEGDGQPLAAAAVATGVTSPKARLSGAEPSVVKGVAATA